MASSYTVDRFDDDGLSLGVRRYARAYPFSSARVPAFVLVHGIGVSPRYFHRLAEELRHHGDVYSVELPGFGRTPRPARRLTVPDLAALVTAFIASEGLDDPVLVGHSMGTQVVVETAVRNPTLSDRVVLIGTVVDPAAPSALRQGWRLMRDMLKEPPSANWLVATDYVRCGPRWYLTQLPSMLEYRIETRLPALAAAALVIRGDGDPVSPAEWSARIVELIPRSSRLDVPRGAHVVQHRSAATVAEAILAHASLDDAGDRVTARSASEG